jgi:hypothetical protein
MTDLVNRYLNAIKPMLPPGQQEDIAAELADALRSRIEEKEEELGRKLTAAEVEAIIQDFGHPMMVAARYGPQQSLIGPNLYPIYLLALKWSVGIAAAVSAAAALLRGITHPRYAPSIFNDLVGDVLHTGLWAVGVTTVVFAIIERTQPHLKPMAGWKPKDLPPAWTRDEENPLRPEVSISFKMSSKGRKQRRSRSEAVFSLVVTIAAGLWILGLGLMPETYPDHWRPDYWLAQAQLTPDPVWFPTLWSLMLVSSAGEAVRYAAELWDPNGVRLRSLGKLIADGASIAFAVVVFQTEALFRPTAGLGGTAYADGLAQMEMWFRVGTAVVAACAALDAIWRVVRIVRGR